MDSQWIAIARTGTFIDSAGREQTFTAADLDNIAASYDPARLEAPLVFGHPATNAPAYGWVKALKRQGEKLFASFAQVPQAVRQLVAQGQYKYVSMSLMPDRQRLRHVGLLGAAVPAIEGLGAVELNHGTNGAEEIRIDFAADPSPATQGVSTMPTPEELQQQIGALQQQLESLKTENAALKKKLEESGSATDEAKKAAESTAADFAAFRQGVETAQRKERVAALVAAGKVPPAEQHGVLSFAATLSEVRTPVDFSAADGTTQQISAEERYFRELEARPVDERFADFAAHAPAPAHMGAGSGVSSFSAADMACKL